MKRTLSLLLTCTLLCGLLSACGEGRDVSTPAPQLTLDPSAVPVSPAQPSASAAISGGPAVTELAEAAFSASGCEDPEAVEHINAGDDAEALAFYVENAYGLGEGEWEDAAVIRAAGASAFEIAVLRCADEDTAVLAANHLMDHCYARQGDFTGYAPAQADMAANGSVNQRGPYAALFICPEPGLAAAAWESTLTGQTVEPVPSDGPGEAPSGMPSASPGESTSETPSASPGESASETPSASPGESTSESQMPAKAFVLDPVMLPVPSSAQYPGRAAFNPPNIDDMSLYDSSAIRDAWRKSDSSALPAYDKDIYEAAKAVLAQTLKEGMSDYQKEAAVYQWLVQNVNYDWTHNDVMVSTPRESFTPYGGLVNRTAVCLGYATSFQLLMDLAGVECITVAGAAHQSTGDHAWNMVRLDGNWYCVDVTWDASRRQNGQAKGLPSGWRYFNVTSSYMAGSDHQWDYANTPEAVTEGNGK